MRLLHSAVPPMLPLPPEDLPSPPPALVRIVADEAYLAFQPTSHRDGHGNRLWDLELWRQGQLLRRWPSVTGSPEAERADRFNRPGNQAPLPPGAYAIGEPIRLGPGDPREIGRSWFIPVEPVFATARGHFGIHQDVSQDGTGGCIGLASRRLTEDVTDWVRASGARWLWVRG